MLKAFGLATGDAPAAAPPAHAFPPAILQEIEVKVGETACCVLDQAATDAPPSSPSTPMHQIEQGAGDEALPSTAITRCHMAKIAPAAENTDEADEPDEPDEEIHDASDAGEEPSEEPSKADEKVGKDAPSPALVVNAPEAPVAGPVAESVARPLVAQSVPPMPPQPPVALDTALVDMGAITTAILAAAQSAEAAAKASETSGQRLHAMRVEAIQEALREASTGVAGGVLKAFTRSMEDTAEATRAHAVATSHAAVGHILEGFEERATGVLNKTFTKRIESMVETALEKQLGSMFLPLVERLVIDKLQPAIDTCVGERLGAMSAELVAHVGSVVEGAVGKAVAEKTPVSTVADTSVAAPVDVKLSDAQVAAAMPVPTAAMPLPKALEVATMPVATGAPVTAPPPPPPPITSDVEQGLKLPRAPSIFDKDLPPSRQAGAPFGISLVAQERIHTRIRRARDGAAASAAASVTG
jgi:hypothetical protein